MLQVWICRNILAGETCLLVEILDTEMTVIMMCEKDGGRERVHTFECRQYNYAVLNTFNMFLVCWSKFLACRELFLYTSAPSVTYKCQSCRRGAICLRVCICTSVFACMHGCVYAGFTDQSDFPVSFSVGSCSHDVNTASG